MGFCLFFHKWGPWEQEYPSSPCKEKRECERCGETERRENHSWSIWKDDPEFPTCYEIRTCRNCGETEKADVHTYPSTTQICEICGKQFDAFMNS